LTAPARKLRFVLVLLPLLGLALLEMVCRLAGVGASAPVFVLAAQGDAWITNPTHRWARAHTVASDRALPIIPARLENPKPKGRFRIFCIGESTVHGFPYHPFSSFGQWMEVRLRTLFPEKSFEVVVCGFPGRASGEILEVAREVVRMEADLLVVYLGHNDFLPWNLGPILHPRDALLTDWLQVTRLGSGVLQWVERRRARESQGEGNLAYRGDEGPGAGLEDGAFERGYRLFERNLRRIVATAGEAGVPVLLSKLASVLDGYEPRGSLIPRVAGLPPKEAAQRWGEKTGAVSRQLATGEWQKAEPMVEQLFELLPDSPHAFYFRGQIRKREGRLVEAREDLMRARDCDRLPFRATRRIQEIIQKVAEDGGAILADPEPLFFEAAQNGIPGHDLFVDICHPYIGPQNLIAQAILVEMAKASVIAPGSEWQFEREPPPAVYQEKLIGNRSELAVALVRLAFFQVRANASRADAPMEVARPVPRLLEDALAADPENASVLAALGIVEALMDDPVKAAAHLEQAWKRNREACLALLEDVLQNHDALGKLKLAGVVDPGDGKIELQGIAAPSSTKEAASSDAPQR